VVCRSGPVCGVCQVWAGLTKASGELQVGLEPCEELGPAVGLVGQSGGVGHGHWLARRTTASPSSQTNTVTSLRASLSFGPRQLELPPHLGQSLTRPMSRSAVLIYTPYEVDFPSVERWISQHFLYKVAPHVPVGTLRAHNANSFAGTGSLLGLRQNAHTVVHGDQAGLQNATVCTE
jgi:hypothetical protein